MIHSIGITNGRAMPRDEVAALYERTGAALLRRCRLILRNAVEAEDALQEVFVRLMRYGRFSREQDVPLAYLYRTAERVCLDKLRAFKQCAPETYQQDVDALEVAMGYGACGQCKEGGRVALFFNELDDTLKQVAILRYLDDLTQERIAEELGWSRRTVGKKLKQLKTLAQTLTKHQEDR